MPVYVVTGTNRGLGLEFVRQLCPSKNNIIVATVRTLQEEHKALDSIIKQNDNVHVLECNTGDVASITQFGKDVEKVLTGKKIDYLVNNSGINYSPEDTALDLTPESLHNHISVNVIGPQKTTTVLLPQMSNDCVIMNMTSGLGSMQKAIDRVLSRTKSRSATYSISKAALNMLTIHQAMDLKDKIKAVITMDPGWVKTDMGGEDAPLEPEESIEGMLKVIHGVSGEDMAHRGETQTG